MDFSETRLFLEICDMDIYTHSLQFGLQFSRKFPVGNNGVEFIHVDGKFP